MSACVEEIPLPIPPACTTCGGVSGSCASTSCDQRPESFSRFIHSLARAGARAMSVHTMSPAPCRYAHATQKTDQPEYHNDTASDAHNKQSDTWDVHVSQILQTRNAGDVHPKAKRAIPMTVLPANPTRSIKVAKRPGRKCVRRFHATERSRLTVESRECRTR